MTRMYLCPCCEQPTPARTKPLTESEIIKAAAILFAQGWTSQRLLAERAETLDALAPGLTDYLRRVIDAETARTQQ